MIPCLYIIPTAAQHLCETMLQEFAKNPLPINIPDDAQDDGIIFAKLRDEWDFFAILTAE